MSGAGATRRRQAIRGRLGRLRDDVRAASVIVEVRDARIPQLSSVARFMGSQQSRIRGVVLTKTDLADSSVTNAWLSTIETSGVSAVAIDLTDGRSAARRLKTFVDRLVTDRRGASGLARVAVVGLPNVGKSTLLNRLVGGRRARTGDRPGITRGKQWIRGDDGWVVLDTPGVIQLFAGLERELGADFFKLVLCTMVPAGQYEERDVAESFLHWCGSTFGTWPFRDYHPRIFDEVLAADPDEALGQFSVAIGCLRAGGIPDIERAARRLVTDVQQGRLGRFSLEVPPSVVSGDEP